MDADVRFMRHALTAAETSLSSDDVPVGAVVVRLSDGEIVASSGNARERDQDPTAHAEILALRGAAAEAGVWRLDGFALFVTLEPCAMCAGAAVLARVDKVVFGAFDPKAGYAGSLGNLLTDERLNHRPEVAGGVLADECGELLRSFFRDRR